jgi:hypothetical protein
VRVHFDRGISPVVERVAGISGTVVVVGDQGTRTGRSLGSVNHDQHLPVCNARAEKEAESKVGGLV